MLRPACPCGRSFGDANALRQHQRALGHTSLPNRLADDCAVEDWHKIALALCEVAGRVRAGEDIDVDAEAAEIGIPPRRMVRALAEQGAVIPEFA